MICGLCGASFNEDIDHAYEGICAGCLRNPPPEVQRKKDAPRFKDAKQAADFVLSQGAACSYMWVSQLMEWEPMRALTALNLAEQHGVLVSEWRDVCLQQVKVWKGAQ